MKTSIEWTEAIWNPVTGCTKISPGCANCYAERMALRLRAMGTQKYARGFELALHEDALDAPLHWRKPQLVFVNSMSDLFHRDVPIEFIQRVFDVMRRASWHTFQILTKRSGRLARLSHEIEWPPNVWMALVWKARTIVFGSMICAAWARTSASCRLNRCLDRWRLLT